jgi:hypothetical protein
MDAEEVLSRHEERLMSLDKDNITGVGITESQGQPAISIMVRQLTPELKAKLPKDLDGVPVKIDVTGEVDAF